MHARHLLAALLVGASCAAPRPAPVAAPVVSPHLASRVAPPTEPPRDEVILTGSPAAGWRLVNHTPVTIEPFPRCFETGFERLGFDGRWLAPRRVAICVSGGVVCDGTPLAPGEARPVGFPYYATSDDSLTAGTWRVFVTYRDPRRPFAPVRASATFDAPSLDAAQVDATLAALSTPTQRACAPFAGVAQAYAMTAPLARLPDLLALPDLTVAELTEALLAGADVTGDTTLLLRAARDPSEDVRRAAAYAATRSAVRVEGVEGLAGSVVFARIRADEAIEEADVDALFALRAAWDDELFDAALRHLTRDASVRGALARRFAEDAWRLSRPELTRLLATARGALTAERDPATREALRQATRAAGEAIRAAVRSSPFLLGVDRGVDYVAPPPHCEPVLAALQPMFDLARAPLRMSAMPPRPEPPPP
jgi:hypothetical protein